MRVRMIMILIYWIVFQSALAQEKRDQCRLLVDKFVVAAKQMSERFPQYGSMQDHYVQKLAAIDPTKCPDSDLSKLIVTALNQHQGKIGVILPLSGELAQIGQGILAGLRTALAGRVSDDQLIVKDNLSIAANDEAIHAELVLKNEVGLIVGGVHRSSASRLGFLAEQLAVPTILLSADLQPIEESRKKRYSLNVFPAPQHLAKKLSAHAAARGISSFAVLAPQAPFQQMLVQHFRTAAAEKGIQSVREQNYTLGDFASMEAAVKTLLQIDDPSRAAELRQLVVDAKQRARKAGLGFNRDMVQLPPVLGFDALFIPDHFKATRHLVQLLKFFGVKQLVVFGAHEWRSEGLVSPWDSFFEGSFFADFIGPYYEIPSVLSPPKVSGYFARVEDASSLDFRLIGWRAGLLIQSGWSPTAKRYAGAHKLRQTKDQNTPYFGTGPSFDSDGLISWPSYVFSVKDKGLVLEGR